MSKLSQETTEKKEAIITETQSTAAKTSNIKKNQHYSDYNHRTHFNNYFKY